MESGIYKVKFSQNIRLDDDLSRSGQGVQQQFPGQMQKSA